MNDDGGDPKLLCLKLNKSLYGMIDSPRNWWIHVMEGLKKLGFTPSESDPGIYFGRGMILILYVDDLLISGPDPDLIDELIKEIQRDFEITREEAGQDAFHFLGIEVKFRPDGKITFTQHGLIEKLLETTGMKECNACRTPATPTPLGTDANGPPFEEQWKYASAVGMMLYLASHAYPEIQFAVHQCARFTHCPKQSHGNAVKRICRYLKHVLNLKAGLTFDKPEGYVLDCYVDADFAGLWKQEDDQDPVCVRSRTGYVMTLAGCPVHWVSKLQTEVALSTLEAEYIALSQAMRDLVPMRRFLMELVTNVAPEITDPETCLKSTVWEDNNGAISTVLSPKMTPRTKHIAVKYHFSRSHIGPDKGIDIEKIDTDLQKADILTKGFTMDSFEQKRKLLCLW